MSSPQSSRDSRSSQAHLIESHLGTADPSAAQKDMRTHWMAATVIEDDDLMFGGKSLSTWYEEERRRQSLGSDAAPERRGRQRQRAPHDGSQPHKHHHHYHGHEDKVDRS